MLFNNHIILQETPSNYFYLNLQLLYIKILYEFINDQVSKIYHSIIDLSRIKYILYQQLLRSTISCINKIRDVENLIVKITCYDQYGEAKTGCCNIMF